MLPPTTTATSNFSWGGDGAQDGEKDDDKEDDEKKDEDDNGEGNKGNKEDSAIC
jgi:hypothetical protein